MKSIVVLAGASGVGKTSVAKKILEKNENFMLVRSATTRAPRGDGHDGEYIYFSEEDFGGLILRDELLEYMNYGGNFYGTPKSEIDLAFSQNKIPLLILDLVGVQTLRERELDFSVFVFYIYDELSVIEKRLYERELVKNPSVSALETFMKRKTANRRDYASLPEIADKFDAFVKNEKIADTAEEIINLFHLLSSGKEIRDSRLEIAKALSLSAK